MRPLLCLLLTACASPEPPSLGDGFLPGVNYPWHHYGHDFGATAWGHDGVSVATADVDAELALLAAAGVTAVRWFVFGDGRAAPSFDGGRPTGLDPLFHDDLDAALALLERHDLYLVPVLFDFLWFSDPVDADGVQLGGRSRVATDPALRAALMDAVIAPLASTLAFEPRLLAWEVVNEPEWAMDGRAASWLGPGIDGDAMRTFVDEVAAALRASSFAPVTVGSADLESLRDTWVHHDLDWLQFHDYDGAIHTTLAADVDPRPIVVGEFASADVDLSAYLSEAADRGFAGAWPWSLTADDDSSELDLAELAQWNEAGVPD